MKFDKIILILFSIFIIIISRKKKKDGCNTPCGAGLICVNGKCVGTVISGFTNVGKDLVKWKKHK